MAIFSVIDTGTGADTFYGGMVKDAANWAILEAALSAATTHILVGGGAGTVPVMTAATGTGSPVRATSPTLVTPALGVATATSINKVAITAPATSATLTIADGKTLTVSGDAEVGQVPAAWTPAITFGGAAVDVTYAAANAGLYVKMGKVVLVTGLLSLTSKGSSVGNAVITGLPFAIKNENGAYSSVTMRLSNITFANQCQGHGVLNTTTLALSEITEAGAMTTLTDADFANNSSVMMSFMYFTA